MLGCAGAAIVGMGRRFQPLSIDRYGSDAARERIDVWTATPWNHLEAGMAFQLDLPLLILKDQSILAEGILDQSVGEYLVYEFNLADEANGLTAQLKKTIGRWAADVHGRT